MRASTRRICRVLLFASLPLSSAVAQLRQPKTHVIKTGPDTVQWGYFDGSRPPIIHIDSGDIVEVETPLDSAKALQSFGAPPELITAAARELEGVPQKDRGPGPNILVGPIAVNGAEPGDVLEVIVSRRREIVMLYER
jgi:acetamidase/formamidase